MNHLQDIHEVPNNMCSSKYSKKIQKHYKTHCTKKSDKLKKNELKKMLKIISIPFTIKPLVSKQQLDYINFCRVSGIIFDKRLFEDENFSFSEYKGYKPFLSWYIYNKVSVLKFSAISKTYEYYLDDIYTQDYIHRQSYDITIVCNRANKSGDEKFIELSKILELWFQTIIKFIESNLLYKMKKISKQNIESHQLDLKNNDQIFGQNLLIKNDRIYFIKLDKEALLNVIRSPFFKVQYDIYNKFTIDGLNLFAHNKKLLDILHINYAILDQVSKGLQVTNLFLSDNFLSLWKKIILFKLDKTTNQLKLDCEELYIYLNGVGKVKGYFCVFKEVFYQKPSKFIIEQYFVFYEE